MADPHPTVGLLIRVRRRKLINHKSNNGRARIPVDEETLMVDLEEDQAAAAGTDTVFVDGVRMTKDDILREDKELLKASRREKDLYLKQHCGKENPEQYYIKVPKEHKPKIDQNLKIEALGIVNRTYKFSGKNDLSKSMNELSKISIYYHKDLLMRKLPNLILRGRYLRFPVLTHEDC
jgi:hypothetical protein